MLVNMELAYLLLLVGEVLRKLSFCCLTQSNILHAGIITLLPRPMEFKWSSTEDTSSLGMGSKE